jgi:hypothetical protein
MKHNNNHFPSEKNGAQEAKFNVKRDVSAAVGVENELNCL